MNFKTSFGQVTNDLCRVCFSICQIEASHSRATPIPSTHQLPPMLTLGIRESHPPSRLTNNIHYIIKVELVGVEPTPNSLKESNAPVTPKFHNAREDLYLSDRQRKRHLGRLISKPGWDLHPYLSLVYRLRIERSQQLLEGRSPILGTLRYKKQEGTDSNRILWIWSPNPLPGEPPYLAFLIVKDQTSCLNSSMVISLSFFN